MNQAEERLFGARLPREKLIAAGAESLSDAELLALILGTGRRGEDVVQFAARLLREFGGIRGLMRSDMATLCGTRGLGPAKCAKMVAALEMNRRLLRIGLERGDAMSSPSATRDYLRMHLRDYRREVFACLFLDNQHRLIAFEELFFGTIDGASVHPREVVRQVLEHNAAAVVFAHNHPSGVAEPSEADLRITQRLQSALALIDVRVLDHMVVGDLEVVSFAERGLV